MIVRKHLDFRVIIRAGWKRIVSLILIATGVSYAYDMYGMDSCIFTSTPASVLGIAISILIGFRVNSAYERWWEARKLWGSIINDSRTITRQMIAFLTDHSMVKKLVYRQIAFVYSLTNHLRNQPLDVQIKSLIDEKDWEALSGEIIVLNTSCTYRKGPGRTG